MEIQLRYIITGIFFLIFLGAIIFTSIILGSKGRDKDMISYQIFFKSSVSGLSEGSPVKYKGIWVGKVTDLSISNENSDEIRALVSIKKNTPVTEGMVASLDFTGITGESYIQLRGAKKGARSLKALPHQPYPTIPSENSTLQDIVQTAPELLGHADILIHKLQSFFDDENRIKVSRILKNVEEVSKDLAPFLNQFKNTLASLETLSQRMVSFVSALEPSVETFTKEGVSSFVHLSEKASETLGHFDGFMNNLLDQVRLLIPAPAQKTYRLDG